MINTLDKSNDGETPKAYLRFPSSQPRKLWISLSATVAIRGYIGIGDENRAAARAAG